MKCQVLYILTI